MAEISRCHSHIRKVVPWVKPANLNPRIPITAVDLAEFVIADSDFALEMQVLRKLSNLEFECSHSGTYQDPVTDKIRQFDLRASRLKDTFRLSLAVECKNLRSDRPLLISAVPRTQGEAFHEVISTIVYAPFVLSERRDGHRSPYKQGEMVGKKTDQVGRNAGGNLFSDDSATFDKLNQAINSTKDLIARSIDRGFTYQVILPVLVVPQDRLWQVDYAENGNIVREPHQVTRTTLFVAHRWSEKLPSGLLLSYRISHLEIVTLKGLEDAVASWLDPSGFHATSKTL